MMMMMMMIETRYFAEEIGILLRNAEECKYLLRNWYFAEELVFAD